jgi:hypothetical protein
LILTDTKSKLGKVDAIATVLVAEISKVVPTRRSTRASSCRTRLADVVDATTSFARSVILSTDTVAKASIKPTTLTESSLATRIVDAVTTIAIASLIRAATNAGALASLEPARSTNTSTAVGVVDTVAAVAIASLTGGAADAGAVATLNASGRTGSETSGWVVDTIAAVFVAAAIRRAADALAWASSKVAALTGALPVRFVDTVTVGAFGNGSAVSRMDNAE